MQPGVVYTTFHHPETGANVVTTEFTDWATGCPEYKVTAVEVRQTNQYSDWQTENEDFRVQTRRIAAE
jgi:formate dehydrogenase major subunit